MGMTRNDVLAAGQAAFHRLAYGDWGEPANPNVLFCVHGLARNSRDFDFLAAAMEDRYRVICPDVLGRGDSDWARDPADYNTQRYLSDMSTVLARIDATTIDWVGTSMGGLIGMTAAAMPGSPIRRLVINDIGPFVPNAALRRIAGYVGNDPRFEDMAAARAHFRSVYDTFG
ncbi:MAG: alpha/beta fold hydrolase, partial [Pseudomonadota bacterium]